MPAVTHTTTVAAPISSVWDFVKEMTNWAPFVSGYQRHEILTDTESIWILRGDMGMLSREVELGVHIDEWVDQERVSFTLTGKNEPVNGGGVFTLATPKGAAAVETLPAPVLSWWQRLTGRFGAWLYGVLFGKREAPASASDQSGPIESTLTFELRMESTGPTAPLVNAMLTPLLGPACEELASRIAQTLSKESS
ncbi:MAG: hypothetical protein ACI9WU_000323 [Myxococcota bacterium]|jgi:hypothetical protein